MGNLGFGYERISYDIKYHGVIIKGIDIKTFEVINHLWAKDQNRVYCKGKKMIKADPNSFIVLNEIFAKDKNYVFYIMGIAHDIDIDEFQVLDVGKIFNGSVDPNSYKMDELWYFWGYAKNKIHVYFQDMMSGKPRKIKNADVNSFISLDSGYASDMNSAYYYGYKIADADPSSFEVISPIHAKDKNNVYYGSDKITNANPKTFKILGHPYIGNVYWAKDDKHFYERNECIGRVNV